ncbi:hypothetical protein N656DRAFT_383147 [Canariomyces notabilis]|uniref:Uncharacterized protein n=1 Tax=Canariomyces notabilis TaxID=2074819 RepID=A0AAN6TJD7_9PEZI|nr:hypothetical protein N656DRAFT_383147 [Canariomyces arenarius]
MTAASLAAATTTTTTTMTTMTMTMTMTITMTTTTMAVEFLAAVADVASSAVAEVAAWPGAAPAVFPVLDALQEVSALSTNAAALDAGVEAAELRMKATVSQRRRTIAPCG